MDHEFSTTLDPHTRNYGAYSDQSSEEEDEETAEEEEDEETAEEEEQEPKDENVYGDSFAVSAQRIFQAGNEIMGTLPTEIHNLTQSASTGVFGPQSGDVAASHSPTSMVNDVKNLFDKFQRYYEPEPVVHDGKKDSQHGSLSLQQPPPPLTQRELWMAKEKPLG